VNFFHNNNKKASMKGFIFLKDKLDSEQLQSKESLRARAILWGGSHVSFSYFYCYSGEA
jgi:hypothetical protein